MCTLLSGLYASLLRGWRRWRQSAASSLTIPRFIVGLSTRCHCWIRFFVTINFPWGINDGHQVCQGEMQGTISVSGRRWNVTRRTLFYLLATWGIGNISFANLARLMRQSQLWCVHHRRELQPSCASCYTHKTASVDAISPDVARLLVHFSADNDVTAR